MLKALILKALSVSYAASQALMPKRCNVLLEAVKELPPLEMLEIKGHGLCHDRTDSASAGAGLCRIVFPCLCAVATFVQRRDSSLSG